MNGVHDMGGLHGFGPVQPQGPGEPLFHATWERRALGLTLAAGAMGQWNIDHSRAARESLPAATYLASSYYQIWILGLQKLLLARGLVQADELAAGHALHPPVRVARVLQPADVKAVLARGTPTERPAAAPPRFAVGDAVRARNTHPSGHTRLPRYVRGHEGRVVRVHGAHVYADAHAVSPPGAPFDEAPTWLYAVEFDGGTLWGDSAEPGTSVCIDAWEPYLDSTPGAP